MTDKPNIYRFASKEFALDATLAYILEFAKPNYQNPHYCINELGRAVLDALIGTFRKGMKKSNIISLEVHTQKSLNDNDQRNQFDILVLIVYENKYRLVLVVENKVGDHDSEAVIKQIKRYKKAAEKKYPEHDIVPVYVNIGNISKWKLPSADICGRFLREDFICVFEDFEYTSNTIVDDFRDYLLELERITFSFRDLRLCEWDEDWRRYQGYYIELENQMNKDKAKWKIGDFGSVHNQQGGFSCFTFAWEKVITKNAYQNKYRIDVYLQIENATRLTLRVGEWEGHGVKAPLMYLVWKVLSNCTTACDAETVSIERTGRFGGGKSAAVAVFTFDEGRYVVLDEKGNVDIEGTMHRLDCVQKIVTNIAEKLRRIDHKVIKVAEIPNLPSIPADYKSIIY